MNLFELFANFWRLDDQQSFSHSETRLYFFLLNVANRSFWAEWIEYPDKKMSANANMSLQVLKSARDNLKSAELLDFVVGGGFRVKTKYQILAPKPALKLSHYNNKTKDTKTKIENYGKGKGFVHSGSDFD
ncbi:hypothetical protein FACS1894159_01980 [Bacteroidia bacterium]|nr:hypothetical protein FACS1894159_01980 [Bacteroidia bacterium]